MRQATLVFMVSGNPVSHVCLGLKKRGFGGKVKENELPVLAALRELEEECGVKLTEKDLTQCATLNFSFPAKSEFNQQVIVFVAKTSWLKTVESEEMKPNWFAVSDIPYAQMWSDDHLWLPQVLQGKKVQASFTFGSDNHSLIQHALHEFDF